MTAPVVSRRIVFSGLGALGVAAALAGCAGGGDGGGGSSPAVDAGADLVGTAEVPVGGGVVLTDQKVVVTQPTEGTFKAFTAVCTHQMLLVTSVEDGSIRCDNHGSVYSAETGEVEGGPARSALAEVPIEVRDDRILAA
ncbi:nitrite reductase/ring-hydroxylating ferredoxin subunit [Nocardioides sp. J9]|uniref:Rieske (2Fe-2S) protein n=1 Tax=unclassified Nocardioides TaxID=2615069 RepID=UPI00048B8AC8|nr:MULTISPECIES: Rieske (2Fe-2S) protein [unclassified Nocardioides]TWG93116.1 nitrite reductase/ring-hydroxylating ferredoxin subunit [Nocardioides sp. J9]